MQGNLRSILKCSSCKEYKDENDFYGSKSAPNRNYREYSCKECHYKRKKSAKLKKGEDLNSYIKGIINKTKSRAKEKSLEYNLNEVYLLDKFKEQDGKCALTNITMTYFLGGKGKIHTNISADRIDSSKGYIKGNIQLVCHIINIMKTDLTMEELINYSSLIIKTFKNKV